MRKPMRKLWLIPAVALLAACASTYRMNEAERSRSYQATPPAAWDAALAAVSDVGMAVVETEPEHGRIIARRHPTFWDFKGHVMFVVIRDLGSGRVRVDANAESFSEDEPVDFGLSRQIVRNYLHALDERLM
ncbi:MAG: hypothetical protein GY856_45480 [bacterium]|nr:hypothetical protein [bacterium]